MSVYTSLRYSYVIVRWRMRRNRCRDNRIRMCALLLCCWCTAICHIQQCCRSMFDMTDIRPNVRGKRKKTIRKKLASTRHTALIIIITIITIILAAKRITSVSRVFATHHEHDRYTAYNFVVRSISITKNVCALKLCWCTSCAFIYVKST